MTGNTIDMNQGMPPQRPSKRTISLKRCLYVTTLDGVEHLAAIADDTLADRRQLDRDAATLLARDDITSARITEPQYVAASVVRKGQHDETDHHPVHDRRGAPSPYGRASSHPYARTWSHGHVAPLAPRTYPLHQAEPRPAQDRPEALEPPASDAPGEVPGPRARHGGRRLQLRYATLRPADEEPGDLADRARRRRDQLRPGQGRGDHRPALVARLSPRRRERLLRDQARQLGTRRHRRVQPARRHDGATEVRTLLHPPGRSGDRGRPPAPRATSARTRSRRSGAGRRSRSSTAPS